MLLAHLRLEPLIALDLRLGEGTGAVLALPLLDAAVGTLNEMARDLAAARRCPIHYLRAPSLSTLRRVLSEEVCHVQ